MLGDPEVRLVGLQHIPVGLQAQPAHHGNERAEYLGPPPSKAGAVYMHKAQVLEVRGDSLQLVGKTKGQMGKVVVEGTLGELYFVEHLSVETHSTYNLTRSIMRRPGPRASGHAPRRTSS